MKKLIVVADDFGWTDGVNKGILKAYREGIVTEISFMLDAPASDNALKIIKKEKIKDVGIHLGLIGWEANKKFLRRNDYIKLFKEKDSKGIEKLARMELEKFEKTVGRKPTHIIPQYGIHGNLKLLQILLEIAEKNNIAMRIPKTALAGDGGINENYAAEIMLKRSAVRKTNNIFGHTTGGYLSDIIDIFLNELKEVKDGDSTEILTHPGYFDEHILKLSSLNYERARDLYMCMDLEFKNKILQLGFSFVSYAEL